MELSHADWLAWRRLGVGSSDAASIHGKSPYRTAFELYTHFTSAPEYQETNFIMERGHEYEPKARALFETYWEAQYKIKESFQPKLFAHAELPFIRASLDGISGDGTTFIEIKYVGQDIYQSLVIPEHYYIQMQHQYLASNATRAFFVCTTDGKAIKHKEVTRDEMFLKEHRKKCAEFWNNVTMKIPPELSDKDFKDFTGKDPTIDRYIELKGKIDLLELQLQKTKEEIVSAMDHPRMRRGDFRVQKVVSRGAIQYPNLLNEKPIAKVLKKYAIDIETFRAPERVSYRITTGKT